MNYKIFKTMTFLYVLISFSSYAQKKIDISDIINAFNNVKNDLLNKENSYQTNLIIDSVSDFNFKSFILKSDEFETSDINGYKIFSKNDTIVKIETFNLNKSESYDCFDVKKNNNYNFLIHYSISNNKTKQSFGFLVNIPEKELMLFIALRNLSLGKDIINVEDVSEIMFLNSDLITTNVIRINHDGCLISFGKLIYNDVLIKENLLLPINEDAINISKVDIEDLINIENKYLFRPIKATSYYKLKPYSQIWKDYPCEYIFIEEEIKIK